LDASLAYARHFPSINWLRSYSLYADILRDFYEKKEERALMITEQGHLPF